jgi:hypothetical protein
MEPIWHQATQLVFLRNTALAMAHPFLLLLAGHKLIIVITQMSLDEGTLVGIPMLLSSSTASIPAAIYSVDPLNKHQGS